MELIFLDDEKPLQGRGFWLRERKVYEVSPSSHVQFIIDHPGLFGLTQKRIREIYAWEHEPLGSETKAREILIRHAASLGWIRIRHYLRPYDYWSLQAANSFTQRRQIEDFVLWAIDQGIMKSHSEVIILVTGTDIGRGMAESGDISRRVSGSSLGMGGMKMARTCRYCGGSFSMGGHCLSSPSGYTSFQKRMR